MYDLDLGTAVIHIAKSICCGVGQVDDSVSMEGAAVVHPYDDAAPVAYVGHPRIGGQRQGRMGGGHREHVVGFAGRRFLAVEFLAVPAADALLVERGDRRFRGVILAENDVRAIGETVQRFVTRFGVGEVVQVVRDVIPRSVVLVVSASPLLDDRGFARAGARCGLLCGFSTGRRIRRPGSGAATACKGQHDAQSRENGGKG